MSGARKTVREAVLIWVRAQKYPVSAQDAVLHFGRSDSYMRDLLRVAAERGDLVRTFEYGVELYTKARRKQLRSTPRRGTLPDRMLKCLREHGTQTRKSVAQRLGVDPGELSNAIRRLRIYGLIVDKEIYRNTLFACAAIGIDHAVYMQHAMQVTRSAKVAVVPVKAANSVFAWAGAAA